MEWQGNENGRAGTGDLLGRMSMERAKVGPENAGQIGQCPEVAPTEGTSPRLVSGFFLYSSAFLEI